MRPRLLAVLAALTMSLAPFSARAGGATDVAGVPSAHVGQHGPIDDFVSGQLRLIGHTDLAPPGSKAALGNNGGLALIGNCAYVGRWHDYGFNGPQAPIQIVDVRNPFGGADGLVIDASHPDAPRLIGAWHGGQPLVSSSEPNVDPSIPAGAGRYSHSISLAPDGTRAYISQWDGGYYTMDTSDFASGAPVPVFKPVGLASVPLPATPGGPGNVHSAVRIPGTSDVVTGNELYVTFGGCPFGWMHVIDTGSREAPAAQIGEFKLRENDAGACKGPLSTDRNSRGDLVDGTFTMHNQTVTSRFVLTSWYGGGLRVIDVANRGRPVEVGYFVPKPVTAITSTPDTTAPVYGQTTTTTDDWWVAAWSYPILRSGLIYVVDMRNGLYVLQAKRGSALSKNLLMYRFLEGNSNLGDLKGR